MGAEERDGAVAGPPADDGATGPVGARARERGITRLRHFTTNAGVTGILVTGEVRSRDLLESDSYLDRIYYPNCEIRRDSRWTGHVSVSVTDINDMFFSICSGNSRWHRGMDGFWAVIELDSAVLDHDDVWFTTTNNMYSNVSQEQGVSGLEAMFADVIYPYRPRSQSPVLVRDGLADNQPTDPQAEVLYPGAVPVEFVNAIVLRTDEDAHKVASQVGYFADLVAGVAGTEVRVDPAAFQQRVPGLESLPPGTDVGAVD